MARLVTSQEKKHTAVALKAMGQAINKTITIGVLSASVLATAFPCLAVLCFVPNGKVKPPDSLRCACHCSGDYQAQDPGPASGHSFAVSRHQGHMGTSGGLHCAR